MNAHRITQLLKTLEQDYDMDTGCAEQGADEDSVMLRSMDERMEIVLRFEQETWLIHYTAHEGDDVQISIRLEGEGWGDSDMECDLTDALNQIADFTCGIGI